MKKKLFILGMVLLTGLVVGGFTLNKSKATDEPPIVTEVKHQGEKLDNHEVRLTNVENDVSTLQSNTDTAPSPNKSTPPAVVTPKATEPLTVPSATPPPAAPPVTATSYEVIDLDGEDKDCKVTYSDGTSETKPYVRISYNQGSKLTTTYGKCSPSDGSIKPGV